MSPNSITTPARLSLLALILALAAPGAASADAAAFRERRAELASRPDDVREILRAGAVKARAKAQKTLARAKQACGLD